MPAGRKPLATVAEERGRLVIAAASNAAERSGVARGQTLADARAVVPALEVADHDAAADLHLLIQLASWCARYSPLVAVDGVDGFFLDIAGVPHLFGGEAAMLEDLMRRLARLGFAVRAGLADTPGAAWACAHFGKHDGEIVPAGAARAGLAGLPVAALRLDAETAGGLVRLGLKRIGDLYDLPRAPVAARFGDEVWRRLDAALGKSEEPVASRHPLPRHRAQLSFADPIVAQDDIARAIRRLLHELCERLQREQLGARRLELTLYRVDGTLAHLDIGTARPLRDPERLALLFAEHLERLDPGFGVETAALAIPLIEACAPDQIALPTQDGESAAFGRGMQEGRAALIERLGNRFGPDHVLCLAARESHVPERATRLLCAFAEKAGAAFPANALRPPRLFAPPHPIEAVAPVPDDPPLLFRWRRIVHRVRSAEGPERIAGEWWRNAAQARDYYRVEDMEGRRFWLYREGPYGIHAPRWFLHGLFP